MARFLDKKFYLLFLKVWRLYAAGKSQSLLMAIVLNSIFSQNIYSLYTLEGVIVYIFK